MQFFLCVTVNPFPPTQSAARVYTTFPQITLKILITNNCHWPEPITVILSFLKTFFFRETITHVRTIILSQSPRFWPQFEMPRNYCKRVPLLCEQQPTINNQLILSKTTINNLQVMLNGNCNTFSKEMWLSWIQFSWNFDNDLIINYLSIEMIIKNQLCLSISFYFVSALIWFDIEGSMTMAFNTALLTPTILNIQLIFK